MKLNKNWCFYICILFYVLLTVPMMLKHVPYYDEAHAWILAKFMNFGNVLDILRTEGHPILWYLIILPFAKLNFHYPYPLLIINYIFALSALIVMWLKAPFSKVFKIIITFSSMFLIFFPICARNYSIGVLGLFILAAMYKDKLIHPIIYALVVFFTIHTHIICAFGASWFGIMLIYEMIRKKCIKKEIAISASLMLLGCILFVLPYIHGYGNDSSEHFGKPGLYNFAKFFISNHCYYGLFYILTVIYIFWKKNAQAKGFLVYVSLLMIFLFAFLYNGRAHHFLFMILYLIFPFWIDSNAEQDKKNKIIACILMCFLFLHPLHSKLHYFYSGNLKQLKSFATKVNQANIQPDSILYVDDENYNLIPYLNHQNIYYFCSLKKLTWQDSLLCNKKNGYYENEILQGNKQIYLITSLYTSGLPAVIDFSSKAGYKTYLYLWEAKEVNDRT